MGLSVSFVIATYNSEKTLEVCLSSIRSQKYTKEQIEIIIADGGSKDSTFAIARKYDAKIINVDTIKQGPEYNRAIGAKAGKNELLAFLDHDNELPYGEWLSDMVLPFLNDKKIVGVETMRYYYDPKDKLLGRYFSLFGVNDVLPFYLGKADRLSYLYSDLRTYGVFAKAKIVDKKKYFVVDFAPNAIPTLGSNGFLIRKDILFLNAQIDPEEFFHIDVNVDLIRKGFKRYAFVKNSIIHKSNERGLFDYFRRRRLFMAKYRFENITKRRYSVYEQKIDRQKLLVFVILSATFIKPLIDSFRGFFKIHDSAWFLHPVICFGTLAVYGVTFLELMYKAFAKRK